MAKTGRHEFTIDRRDTPLLGTRDKPRNAEENQALLRQLGAYSRRSKREGESWPSLENAR